MEKENQYVRLSFKKDFILINAEDRFTYEISLDRLKTPNQALDWIHQINSKTWANPVLMKELVTMIFKIIPMEWWSGA